MRNIITFGGTPLSDFGLYNNGRSTYNAPAKDYTMVKITGKNGDLVFDNKRFENYDLTYPSCWIDENFETNIEALRAYLMSRNGYQRLSDTYHPNEFRMAVCKNALDIDVDMYNKHGTFDLVFNCKPQRYLITGETQITLTEDGSITNPTQFSSEPLIRFYGSGTVEIGDQSISIANQNNLSFTDIDCEIKEAYHQTTSRNNSVSFSNYTFPVLKPGVNNITLGGATKLVITPRWWTI